MRATARDWLPPEALTDPILVAGIEAAVAAWSCDWFGERPVQALAAVRLSMGADGLAAVGAPWRRFAPGCWLAFDDKAGQGLAFRALGYGKNRPKANAADEGVLSRYAEHIAAELADALCAALDASGAESDEPADPPAGVIFELAGADGGLLLRLLLEEAALVRRRKALCAPWKPDEAKSRSLADALAAVEVAFEASLGIGRTTALEFHDLAPGDIIVLERATTDPVLLLSRETGAVMGGARLVPDDGAYFLQSC
ncbi:MAG: hypothetical protein WCY29_13090 [Novosphingobium sp.]